MDQEPQPDRARTERALGALCLLSALGGLVCIIAPAVIVSRPGGPDAAIGSVIYAAAIAALAITPLQLIATAVVIVPRLRAALRDRRVQAAIDEVLSAVAVRVAFQPVVDLATGTVVGVEALARFDDGRTPDRWFADAERVGRGLELELLAVRTALHQAVSLPVELDVAVNVSPAALASRQLLDLLDHGTLAPERVLLEVTEHASVDDYLRLQDARRELRRLGVRVAVDDAGAGYSSFRHILALAPDVIKLDRSLVSDLDRHVGRQSLVSAVVAFAAESGAEVVGEGVETPAELAELRRLGVTLVQGYHLGRPTTDPADWDRWNEQVPARG